MPIVLKSESLNLLEPSGPVDKPAEGLINLTLNILLGGLTFLKAEVDKFKDF